MSRGSGETVTGATGPNAIDLGVLGGLLAWRPFLSVAVPRWCPGLRYSGVSGGESAVWRAAPRMRTGV